MMLVLTLIVIIVVVLMMINEGLLTAITTCVNVVLAGMVSFSFYEPLAAYLETSLTFMADYVDAVAMAGLFMLAMGLLRMITNQLGNEEAEMSALFQQVMTGLVSAVTGYLMAGFLTVMLSTMPVTETFMGHDPAAHPEKLEGLQHVVPPDRVWLGLMHGLGAGPFSQDDWRTFDPDGTWPMRHARQRRIKEQ
jgi:hypothetical protein